ncbi:MAG: gephyrin-like molybdotransferase Glp [Alphaproteobacteria bacterium]
MISVEEALTRITGAFGVLDSEQVPLGEALGRVAAEDVTARVTQPPVAVSAMDGYAVRAADLAQIPAALEVVGEAPAGRAFAGRVGNGQAVRIFTGGPVPDGADCIVIQENTEVQGARVTVNEGAEKGRFIRPAGLDFKQGDVGIKAGKRLGPRDIGLAAAMNVPVLRVRRRPVVAILSTGDELVGVGETVGPNRIIGSNGPALAAFVAANGGVPLELGIAADTPQSLQDAARRAEGADLLVSTGGVSVGARDLVQGALQEIGLEVDFWQVAMRPGKPLLFGLLGRLPILGFPGNPVSALVCAVVYLRPALDAMLGRVRDDRRGTALLGVDLPANDHRQDYLRSRLSVDANGNRVATPFSRQDSAMLAFLADADCLVVRPPKAPPAKAGAKVSIIVLADAESRFDP